MLSILYQVLVYFQKDKVLNFFGNNRHLSARNCDAMNIAQVRS